MGREGCPFIAGRSMCNLRAGCTTKQFQSRSPQIPLAAGALRRCLRVCAPNPL